MGLSCSCGRGPRPRDNYNGDKKHVPSSQDIYKKTMFHSFNKKVLGLLKNHRYDNWFEETCLHTCSLRDKGSTCSTGNQGLIQRCVQRKVLSTITHSHKNIFKITSTLFSWSNINLHLKNWKNVWSCLSSLLLCWCELSDEYMFFLFLFFVYCVYCAIIPIYIYLSEWKTYQWHLAAFHSAVNSQWGVIIRLNTEQDKC